MVVVGSDDFDDGERWLQVMVEAVEGGDDNNGGGWWW